MPETKQIENPRSYRATSWIRRGEALQAAEANKRAHSELDLDLQFVCYWIAFNALYGQAKHKRQAEPSAVEKGQTRLPGPDEWLQIHDFLDKIIALDAAKSVRQLLTGVKDEALRLIDLEFLYRGYWDEQYHDVDLKVGGEKKAAERSWIQGTPETRIKHIFDRIYVLRNQVLHGAAKYESSSNRDSVIPAVAVLSKLVPVFRDIVRAQGPNWEIENLPFPPARSERHPTIRRTMFKNSPRTFTK